MINADIMTAIITPFGDDGTINFDALERLTNHCIETGSKGFVIGGTTGETPTLSHDEKIELYTRFAKIVMVEERSSLEREVTIPAKRLSLPLKSARSPVLITLW